MIYGSKILDRVTHPGLGHLSIVASLNSLNVNKTKALFVSRSIIFVPYHSQNECFINRLMK